MIRKILPAKDPFLRQAAKSVPVIDKKVREVIVDLKDTLSAQKDPEGVGLAAPQIGKNLRMFFVNHQGFSGIFINPEIESLGPVVKNAKQEKIMEGCLSLPHYYGPLVRASSINLKYLDETGTQQIQKISGFPAQIVQHEIDHLNGILFVDRLLEQKRKLFKLEGDESWEEVDI